MKLLKRLSPALGAIGAAIAIAGCGGGGSDDDAGPLANALGYLPENAPLAIAIDTDIDGDQFKALRDLAKKSPLSGRIEDSLKQSLQSQSFDFEKDLKPLLGNEFVVGATDARSITDDSDSNNDFVGAIQAKDQDKLDEVVKRSKAEEDGEKGGAKIYKDDDGDAFAINDDVLVVAGSRQQLDAALEQRDGENGLTEQTFDKGTADLPKEALVRVYANLQTLIGSEPDAKQARKIKWVDALRTLGATASAKGDEIDVDFRLTTDSEGLSDKDLPIAAGDASPDVIERAGEIGAGIRDPKQIVDFAESALQATDSSRFGDYRTGRRAIEAQLDVDIDQDLLGQLEDDVALSFSPNGKFGLRAGLKDAAAFERTLNKLGRRLPDILENAVGQPVGYAKRGDFNALSTADGDTVVYGVVDGSFVLANDPSRAGQLAKESPKPVDGAKGSVVLSADAQQLVSAVLQQQGGGLGGALGGAVIAGPLDKLTGSVAASTDGLVGNFRLTFD